MRQIVYYYDPILKSKDNRWSVDVYVSDGKKTFWEATLNGDTYSEVLCNVRNFVNNLNKTIALFGINGKINMWFWWMKRNRN
jgi:hypothetical protein